MKLIIAGGMDFEDKVLAVNSFMALIAEVNYTVIPNKTITEQNNDTKSILVRENPFTEIISGGARVADRVGEFVAKFYNIPVKRFIPDCDGFGERADGLPSEYVRNVEMVEYAVSDYNDSNRLNLLEKGALLVFWDKESKGTAHMINIAKQKGLIVKTILY